MECSVVSKRIVNLQYVMWHALTHSIVPEIVNVPASHESHSLGRKIYMFHAGSGMFF